MASHTPPGSKSYETDARARLCPALLCVLSQARQTAMHEDSQHKSSLSLTHVTPSSRPIPLNSRDTSPHITKHAAAIRAVHCDHAPLSSQSNHEFITLSFMCDAHGASHGPNTTLNPPSCALPLNVPVSLSRHEKLYPAVDAAARSSPRSPHALAATSMQGRAHD